LCGGHTNLYVHASLHASDESLSSSREDICQTALRFECWTDVASARWRVRHGPAHGPVPNPAVRSKTPHVVTIAIVEWRSQAHDSTQIRLKRVGWVRNSRESGSTFSKSAFYAEGPPW